MYGTTSTAPPALATPGVSTGAPPTAQTTTDTTAPANPAPTTPNPPPTTNPTPTQPPTTTGGTTPFSTTLAPWSAEYLMTMLGQASALAQQPYQAYQGAMTAGPTELQNQAFQGIGGLQNPAGYGQAQQGMQSALQGLQGINYSGGNFANQYNAPDAYQGATFTNQFEGPQQFQAANMQTGQWNQQAAQQYMNPYLQESLNPQLDQARRQADISRMAQAGQLSKAGAFGGSRQALMEAEGDRNLLRNMADITGKGYFDAYNTGMAGFMQDQGRSLDVQKANEQSRQFGSGQDMTAAQQRALYGSKAAEMGESSRQFGYDKLMDSAAQRAQYGNEAMRLGEQSRQFGADLGLKSLMGQADTSRNMGALAGQEHQSTLANLQAQLNAGATQRGIEQEGLDSEYALWAQAQQHPYNSLEFMKSMLAGVPTVIDQGGQATGLAQLLTALQGAGQINDSGIIDMIRNMFGGGAQ
jgi:hypothetical protein